MKKEGLWEKIKEIIRIVFHFIVNPRLLFCFAIAWMLTNGWSYILLGLGTYYEIEWMIFVAGGYLAFIWLPITPEKIITLVLSIWLLRHLFPQDEKTLGILKELYAKQKQKKKARKSKSDSTETKMSDVPSLSDDASPSEDSEENP